MNSKPSGRRQFLKDGAALAALTMGAMRSARGQSSASEKPEVHPKDLHAYGGRSRFENSSRMFYHLVPLPFLGGLQMNPLQDQVGIITPASLHFVSSHGYEPPDIDPRQHRLLIHGLVDRPRIFTLEELKRLPSVSRIHFVECSGNTSPSLLRAFQLPGTILKPMTIHLRYGLTSCSEWTGVPLSLLLNEAGVQKGATWLVAEGADQPKHTKSIPLEKAMDDVLVAYGQNGEAVRPEQGYPLRLVIPGWEGISNVKWLKRIKVVDQPYMARMESTAYPSLRPDGKSRWFQFQMGPKSVITFPSDVHQLPSRGFYEIRGLAWSAGGTIRRVEVSTDGGRNWKDAEIQEPVHRIAHTRFRFPWNWDGKEAVLQSRCTDERGDVQPTLAQLGKIWGVDKEYWQTTLNVVNPFNPIQPWEVTRDGSVHNALF